MPTVSFAKLFSAMMFELPSSKLIPAVGSSPASTVADSVIVLFVIVTFDVLSNSIPVEQFVMIKFLTITFET
jgi:hypothetical protein